MKNDWEVSICGEHEINILNQTTAEYDASKALDFLKNYRKTKRKSDIELE